MKDEVRTWKIQEKIILNDGVVGEVEAMESRRQP
jgi:hypothetical protein